MEISKIIENKYGEFFIQDNSIRIINIYKKFNICEVIYNNTGLKTFVDACEISKVNNHEKYISFHRLRRCN